MQNLNEIVKDFVLSAGVAAMGVCTPETLAGGPPSTELERVLPGAKAAVSFAMALNQEGMEAFLSKSDPHAFNEDNFRVNRIVDGIALELASFLDMLGHASVPVATNNVYRKDTPMGALDEHPVISHRYLAVRSGVGQFGLSGNVIRQPEGAAIILGAVVTTAELEPTAPIPPEDNYCDQCRLCMGACASGFMDANSMEEVIMGDDSFAYSKRKNHWRCDYVCGGFSGLHPSGKWSTWSPARFPIPDTDEGFLEALRTSIKPYVKRPRTGPRFYNPLLPNYAGSLSCCHCQLICHPDKEVRKKRFKTLMNSGVVVQDPDGSLRAVSPDEARDHIATMDGETRALYEHS